MNNQTFFKNYLVEVLGVKNYLCLPKIHSLRSLKGSLPCQVLVVVFSPLSSSQKQLLRKIMSSIDVFEFSLLEIREDSVLKLLLLKKEELADFICFFGQNNMLEKELSAGKGAGPSLREPEGSPKKVWMAGFDSLGELEGNSPEIQEKKKRIWNKLKEMKLQLNKKTGSKYVIS